MEEKTSSVLPRSEIFPVRQRDRDRKRMTVLETAARLFLEQSYSRTSLNDVAVRLHITKPALYHYFRSKEEILLECYRVGAALIGESLDKITTSSGSGLEKVQAFIRSYAKIMAVDFGRCVARLDDGELSPAARAEVRGYKREIDARLRRLIEAGIADGSIASCDSKMASFAIAGAVNWIGTWYAPDGTLTADAIAVHFARLLTEGIQGMRGRSIDV